MRRWSFWLPDLVGSCKISSELEEIMTDLVEIFPDLRLRKKGRAMVDGRGVHESSSCPTHD